MPGLAARQLSLALTTFLRYNCALTSVRSLSNSTSPPPAADSKMVKYLNQSEAIAIDQELFNEYQFSVDQLMELAGLSCAHAAARAFPISAAKHGGHAAILCGPGNNGGDGLVCARHLKLMGYVPSVWYPKAPQNNDLMTRLVHQVKSMDIEVSTEPDWNQSMPSLNFVVDAMFGFSFRPPPRPPFAEVIQRLASGHVPVLSVDIPSGWNVESGPSPGHDSFMPTVLVSLTAPKLCAMFFKGRHHFLGGRFVPQSLADKYSLNLPAYPGVDSIVELTAGQSHVDKSEL